MPSRTEQEIRNMSLEDKMDAAHAEFDRRISRAQRYRQQRSRGVAWTPPSDPDAPIRVRKLSLSDRATINRLPDYLRTLVFKAIDGSDTLSGRDGEDATERASEFFGGMTAEQKLDAMYDLSASLVMIGWIEPRVVATEDELTDDAILIDDVDEADRLAFMNFVTNGAMREAAPLATFPDGPGGGVGAVPDGEAVGGAPEPAAGPHAERADAV